MPDMTTITLVITTAASGHATVHAHLPKPRPGMRIENAAHSLALDALGWLGKQPATSEIVYCDPTLEDQWLERVRQYLNEETSERFLTLQEILAAIPALPNKSRLATETALRKLLAHMDWLPTKRARGRAFVIGYIRPSNIDLQACEALVTDLNDPEGFGHAVSPEVRNAARRALGVKGQMEGLAA